MWLKIKVCQEGVLSGLEISLEGNTQFLELSVALQAGSIAVFNICDYALTYNFFLEWELS